MKYQINLSILDSHNDKSESKSKSFKNIRHNLKRLKTYIGHRLKNISKFKDVLFKCSKLHIEK
jgi:hypothetical protein